MKTKKITGSITLPKNKKLCKLYRQLGAFSENTNRLPDAQEIMKNKNNSVPLELLPMIF